MSDDIISYSSEDRQGLVSGRAREEDLEPEIVSLRPRHLTDYVGQADVVETLKIAIEAAVQRNEPIDHVLLHGPPGLGKTTLAHIIANETGSNLTLSSGPADPSGFRRHSVHRRDPPPPQTGGGAALPGHGGFRDRFRLR